MGLFDLFKKKETQTNYDPSNIKITDLDLNWICEYDLKTWVVKEKAKYVWREGGVAYDFKLDSGEEEMWLNIYQDDELYLSVSQSVKPRSIDEDLPEQIEKDMRPPKKLVYNNMTYYLEEESVGHYYDLTKEENPKAQEVTEWTYYDESEQNLIAVAEWGSFNFSASVGVTAEAHEFSNILPASTEEK